MDVQAILDASDNDHSTTSSPQSDDDTDVLLNTLSSPLDHHPPRHQHHEHQQQHQQRPRPTFTHDGLGRPTTHRTVSHRTLLTITPTPYRRSSVGGDHGRDLERILREDDDEADEADEDDRPPPTATGLRRTRPTGGVGSPGAGFSKTVRSHSSFPDSSSRPKGRGW